MFLNYQSNSIEVTESEYAQKNLSLIEIYITVIRQHINSCLFVNVNIDN